jgi:hypothetical protein
MNRGGATRSDVVVGIAVALVMVGCTPVKPTHPPITLRTAMATVDPADCPANEIDGALVESETTGLGIVAAALATLDVTWPFGYSAVPSVAGGILLDPTGTIVAYTGERVRILGGIAGADGTWLACGTVLAGLSVESATPSG